MKIRTVVSLSRDSSEMIRLRIRDGASGIEFASLSMTTHDFAMIITGMVTSGVECDARGLENVGKRLVIEPREVICPLSAYDRDKLRAWLNENCQEDGWSIDDYLGSQGSISGQGDQTVLRYNVRRYEEIKGDAP